MSLIKTVFALLHVNKLNKTNLNIYIIYIKINSHDEQRVINEIEEIERKVNKFANIEGLISFSGDFYLTSLVFKDIFFST